MSNGRIKLPPVEVADLPDDPVTRDQRYTELAAWLEVWEQENHASEPDWDVEALFPPGRIR